MNDYTPTPDDKFTFGLWTVGWQGVDVFGGAVRPLLDPVEATYRLAELGAAAVTFHDDDLVPDEPPASATLERFSKALAETGLWASRWRPRTCSATRCSRRARSPPTTARYAATRSPRCCATSTWPPSSAPRPTCCGAAARAPSPAAAKDVAAALDRYERGAEPPLRLRQGAGLRPPLRARAQAERAARRHPAADDRARARAIAELDDPTMVGLNPEVGHEEMAGLNFAHGIARRCGTASSSTSTSTASTARASTRTCASAPATCAARSGPSTPCSAPAPASAYDGFVHFDYKPPRTEDDGRRVGIGRACMRNYLILREQVQAFRADPDVRSRRWRPPRSTSCATPTLGAGESLADLRAASYDVDALAARSVGIETPRPAGHGAPARASADDRHPHDHTHEGEMTDDPTDHAVHRPVGRPAVRGDVPARLGLGLRRPRDRLLGRPLRPVGRGRGRRLRPGQAGDARRSTACRSSRSATTSRARPSATTRSTSGTAASCPTGSGATATPRASASGRPRR